MRAMRNVEPRKPLVFIGPSRQDLRDMPDVIQDRFGLALFEAQKGRMPGNATPLKGYRGAGVLDMIEDYESDTYRAVYTVRFAGVVYVLHVFQKKSHHGIKTPRQDLALIGRHLKDAEYHYRHVFQG